MLFFEKQENGWDLSLMKVSYNLTKRTTKTEKVEKYFKMFIINFKTIRYKLTASGNINHSILNYKPMRPVINLWLPKEQKQQNQEKLSEKSVEGIKKMKFSLKTLPLPIIFKSNGISLFYQYYFKKINKYEQIH